MEQGQLRVIGGAIGVNGGNEVGHMETIDNLPFEVYVHS
jgi:hypothetical protein